MNFIQKLLKRTPSVVSTDFYKGMYQYIGYNSPAWIDQNNEAYIDHGFAKNADVYAIVNYIIKRIATIPWKVYSMNENGELTEIKNHPLIDLIEKPNPMMGQSFFMQTLFAYKFVTGNSYIYTPKLENGMNAGRTEEMWVMPATKTEIVSNGYLKPVDHYRFMGTTEPKFRPEDVIHLKYVNLGNDSLYGMSPLKAGAMVLTKSNDAHTSEVRSFQNMGAVGILSENSKDGRDSMTQEQASFIKTWWQSNYGGPENRGKIHITSQDLKWINLGLSPVDLNIMESLKLSFRQLCNLYQFPSQLLNDNEHATYNNMREAKKALYTDVIIPEAQSLRDELNRSLVPAYGENLYLDLDLSGIDVLQDNKKELVEYLEKAWWIKGIDKQRIMGMTEDPEMDKYFIPTSIIEMGSEAPDELDDELKKLLKIGVNDYSGSL